MTAILIENLTCGYGQKLILKDISFGINEAEFFCIIGSNGSGKTTLLKAINQTLKVDSGSVKILDQPASDYSRRHFSQLVAVVTQEVPFDIPYTVKEIVMMGRYPHLGVFGLEKQKDFEIVESVMVFTDISHLADRKLNQISGGERQRVFIARAISQEPKIILLDEPTTALDLAHQISVMDLMEKLKNEQGITVVMISHDINLAAMYSDRLLLLKNGQLVKLGTPTEVITYDTLEDAYGCVLMVEKSPLGNFPQVSLVPHRYTNESLIKRNQS